MDTCPDQANTCLLEFSHLKLKCWRTGNSLLSIHFLNRFLDFRLILWFSITSTRYLVMYLKYLMCKTWQIEIASIILFGLVIFKKSTSCADGYAATHFLSIACQWSGDGVEVLCWWELCRKTIITTGKCFVARHTWVSCILFVSIVLWDLCHARIEAK